MSDAMLCLRDSEEKKNYRKLAIIHACCCWGFGNTYDHKFKIFTERAFEQPGDINYQIPRIACLISNKPNMYGSTALHLLTRYSKIETILEREADFTIKNKQGLTPIHQVVQSTYDECKYSWQQVWFQSLREDDFIEALLSAHVKKRKIENPCDNRGVSHFHVACMVDHSNVVEFFLNNGVSVNQAIRSDSPYLAGYTSLHIAGICGYSETARVLLHYGADTTIRNFEGMTPLRSIVNKNMEIVDWMYTRDATYACSRQLKRDVRMKEDVIKLILSNNILETNEVDELGFSFFHAACTLSDTSIAERFLRRRIDLRRHAIKMDSPVWPGYTALHFAAHFNVNMVHILMEYGADIEAKDYYGVTPFDICVERFSVVDIHIIVASHISWRNITLSNGTTRLDQLIYMMRTIPQMRRSIISGDIDVKAIVPPNSPLWPGYSILHLAAIFPETVEYVDAFHGDEYANHYQYDDPYNMRRRNRNALQIKRIELCLNNMADVTIKDIQGFTPIHLAFRLQMIDAVDLMLKYQSDTVNHIDEDNLSHFYMACFVKNTRLVKTMLKNGVDVNISLSSTFRWHKNETNFINKHRSLDLKSGGLTPLHAAVKNGAEEITYLLLRRGADVNAKDENGLTPLHNVFSYEYHKQIAKMLLACPNLKEVVYDNSLSHLHIASFYKNVTAMEKLLNNGANINATVGVPPHVGFKDYNGWSLQPINFMQEFSGCTPLYITLNLHNNRIHIPMQINDAAKLLLDRGADPFIRNWIERCMIYTNLSLRYLKINSECVIEYMLNSTTSQTRLTTETGVTLLHVACWQVDVDKVKALIDQGVNLNAQTRADSPIWPKWTPMHVLMLMSSNSKIDGNKVTAIFELLLQNGVDLTLVNVDLDTPLHLTEPEKCSIELMGCISYRSYSNSPFTGLLLKELKDCNFNPTNISGISHFHIASLRNDVENVCKFLERGVEVNKSIDLFSERYPGCNALHLALYPRTVVDISLRIATVKLLIDYGADVNSKDIYSNTPMHLAVHHGAPDLDLLGILLSAGADINAINMIGETALEVLLKSGNFTSEDLRYFLQLGYKINSCNIFTGLSYIGIIASHNLAKTIFSTWDEVLENNNDGRTAIHAIVSLKDSWFLNYTELLDILMSRAVDIDHQDNEGKTALHVAVEYFNMKAISALLEMGADINQVDIHGNTVLTTCYINYNTSFAHYCTENYSELVKSITTYAYAMQLCGLPIHELNEKALIDIPLDDKVDHYDIRILNEEIDSAKEKSIGSTKLTLCDFLTEARAWTDYATMPNAERREIDTLFQSISLTELPHEFPGLIGILRLRYRQFLSEQIQLKV